MKGSGRLRAGSGRPWRVRSPTGRAQRAYNAAMKDIFDQIPKTIAESAKSPLGVVSLIVLVLSFLGYAFFAKASEAIRVGMFVLMFAGYGLLGASLVRGSFGTRRRAVSSRKTAGNTQAESAAPLPVQSVPMDVSAERKIVPSADNHVRNVIALERVMRRLAFIWFGGAFLVTALLATQTVLGKYVEPQVPFAWFAPLAFPVSSVLIGALMFDRLYERMVPKMLARVATRASALSVALLFAAIVLEPVFAVSLERWLSAFTMYLAPIEGIATAAITYMLVAAIPSGSSPTAGSNNL